LIKPPRITEEEVSVSKENKICLVCKGKVGGFNFICTECGAFYCMKRIDYNPHLIMRKLKNIYFYNFIII
jgi:hypothetical protein